jgi:hypothetical protein
MERYNAKVEVDHYKAIRALAFVAVLFLYLFWGLFGFMTSQWPWFIAFFALSITSGIVGKKIKSPYVRRVDAVLSTILLLVILLDYFHNIV